MAADMRSARLTLPSRPVIYTPLAQEPTSSLAIAVRSSDGPRTTALLRDLILDVDPNIGVTRIESMDASVARPEARRRFLLLVLGLFGTIATLLAAVGVYGVVAHVTGLRRRELTLRMALGARAGQVKTLVMGQGLTPVALGLAIGMLAAWWMTEVIQSNSAFRSQLFQITHHDPVTFAGAAVTLLGAALLACWLPTRALHRLQPSSVLKAE